MRKRHGSRERESPTRRTFIRSVTAGAVAAAGLAAGAAAGSAPRVATLAAALTLAARPGLAQQDRPSLTEGQKAALQSIERGLTFISFDPTGVPSWLRGDLGPAEGDPGAAAQEALRRLADVYRMTDDDSFAVRLVEADDLGETHVRLQQQHRRRRVVGAELIVHIRRDRVAGINGHFLPDLRPPAEPRLGAEEALAIAEQTIVPRGATPLTEPELVVFVDGARRAHLSWTRAIEYVGDNGYGQVAVFADVETGDLLGRHDLIHTAKDRRIHDGTGVCLPPVSALPGPLVVQEGGIFPGIDEPTLDAYIGTGKTYDFYRHALNRDSYDGSGAPLVSSVHVTFDNGQTCSPNNAAWIPLKQQMVYGDGDGSTFTHLSNDVDVTAHELTHAVTFATANLTYNKEPGALNEAFSDIFGEVVDAFQACPGWKIGENVYTPNTPGDALRYMSDPTLDGKSLDYYPDLLVHADWGPGCVPVPGNDNCGIHYASGIANLAFKLLASGGSHPHGKTFTVVPAVGIDLAARIFHRALRYYLTPNSQFGDAMEATIQAADDIAACSPMRSALLLAVDQAWHAVGAHHPVHNANPGPSVRCSTPWVNLMYNGGFEASGNNSFAWTASLGAGVINNSGGFWQAQLGGNGQASTESLYQQVSIPEVATYAWFSFGLRVQTDEVTNALTNDDLIVELRTCNGWPIATLASFSNLDAGGYGYHDFDVTAYKGQTVRIYLKAVENATHQTTFNLDNFALKVK